MCGLAGIYRRDGGEAGEAVAAAMTAAMPHRGPDGRGTWAAGEVALGHARLAVRELGPAGAQPMRAPGGEGVLVYVGEVYGERPLREELAREGAAFRGSGDAEVLLHALARWGVLATLPRLDGMFAFAWWDARERALWLARDRFGIKTLHVAATAERVLFASELRGLRAVEGVARRPDLLELARVVVPWRTDASKPPFEGVESVGAGEAWKVGPRSIDRMRWWDPARDLDVDRLVAAERGDPAAWAADVERAVTAAVESHLVSDVPLAAFVSGGVDSNLVAAIAKTRIPDLVGFTVDTCHPRSEAPRAARTAAHLGLSLRTVRVDREAHLRHLPEAVEALEHPALHPSQPEMLLLCRAARAAGFTVVLTGEGADELFGGYDFLEKTHARWARALSPWRAWRGVAREERARLEATPFYYQAARKDAELAGRVAFALAPSEDSRARALLSRLARVDPPQDRAFLAHALDALDRHLGRILLRHDRHGMAASLECRVPFLSRGVADVALHLPRRAKLHRGVGKCVLKRVAAKRLPAEVVRARKEGFPVPDSHHRGASALLAGGAVPDLFRWPKAAEDDLVARVERDPVLRHQAASLEVWARLFVRDEPADTIAERLLSVAGSRP
jgi:asparagine synthase (glutamine-hydrolysing)